MRVWMRAGAASLLAAAGLSAACADSGGSTGGGEGGDAQAVGGGEGGEGGAAVPKGDCPDCDEAGPGALEQAGLSDRFYLPGDRWSVAWSYALRGDMARVPTLNVLDEELDLGDDAQPTRGRSEVFLFDYAVDRVQRREFALDSGARVQRSVAAVTITPGVPSATAHPEVFSGAAIGAFETRLDFELNDLLEPVSETIYDRRHPNGRRVELDRKSRLQTGSSLFPHTVPRVLTQSTQAPGATLGLSPEVEAAADAFAPGWRERVYEVYRFEGLGDVESQGDVVAWAKGDLWPFYARTAEGEGVRVAFTAAAP